MNYAIFRIWQNAIIRNGFSQIKTQVPVFILTELKRFYLDRCTASETYCTEGTTCTQGQCQCPGGGTFNNVLRMCTLLKATGENCDTVADCYSELSNCKYLFLGRVR